MQVITDILNMLLRSAYLLILAACTLPVIGVWFGDLHWTLDLASQFLLPAVVVACVLAIFAGLTRHTLIGVGALLVAIVASSEAGPWMTVPTRAPANAPVFSVLFLNVWIRNNHLDQVATLIREKNADIVVLVEASPRLRDAIKDVAQTYPYHADCADNAGCGTIILSRARMLPLDISSSDVSTLSVQTDLAGCQMPVTAVHLRRPFPFSDVGNQMRQAVDVSNLVSTWSGAQLVMGDFNAAPWSAVMKTILRSNRLGLLTGSGGTWPSVLPKQMRIPIDHMMAGRGLSFVSRELPGFVGSDHVPVLARVAVTDPSMCINR
jgi:endonuclease/exonuclease/phosphatase (EEP) superfamily protein YafD